MSRTIIPMDQPGDTFQDCFGVYYLYPLVAQFCFSLASGFSRASASLKSRSSGFVIEIATDILFRPDVAAYEYLATGSLYGEKRPRVRLDEKSLSAEQKAGLPNEFYGPKGVDPNELAKIFAYSSGEAMIDRLAQLFAKWGYVDRNQMLNNVIDEEVARRKRKASALSTTSWDL